MSECRAERPFPARLPPQAGKLLRDWIAYAEPRLFVFEGKHHESLSVRQAQSIATRHLGAIGRRDLHCHSLRHTFGAMITRATRSIFVTQRLLGHTDPRVTARAYSCFDPSDADDAADALAIALAARGRPKV